MLARQRGQPGKDVAAALRPGSRRSAMSSACCCPARAALEFLGDQRDRRERRAELVGRGRREPVERREMLLAGKHHLGRIQRLGELARLLGDAEGIDAGEDAGRDQRRPRRRRHRRAAVERSSPGYQGSGRWKTASTLAIATSDRAEEDGGPRRQRRRRDDHAGREAGCEGVFEPAGEDRGGRRAGRIS